MRRPVFAAGIIALAVGCRAPGAVRPSSQAGQDLVRIVRSGNGRAFGDVLALLAHSEMDAPSSGSLGAMLLDPDVGVRSRAATALGAIGPAATDAVAQLRRALSDSSVGVRREAAFALGAIRAADSLTLDALVSAMTNDGDAIVKQNAVTAITQFVFRARVVPSAQLAASLQSGLRDTTLAVRRRALGLMDPITASWKLDALRALLTTWRPGIRGSAAATIARMGRDALPARAEIARLAADTVEFIRAAVPQMLADIDNGPPKGEWFLPGALAGVPNCPHRWTTGFYLGGRDMVPTEFLIAPGSASLRGDGRGSYSKADGAQSVHDQSYNLFLPYAPPEPGEGRTTARPIAADRARWIDVDLSRPALGNGHPALGIVRDSALRFHAHYMRDARGYIWNTLDVPIGARVLSDHTEVDIVIHGNVHRLQFGPWSLDACSVDKFGRAPATGSSQVMVERISEREFRFNLAPGSVGRLFDYTDPAATRDLGLFVFSFDVTVRTQ